MARLETCHVLVFVCVLVFIDIAIAECITSKSEDGEHMKCFNATLHDVISHGGPNVSQLMIFQSRIENIPNRLLSRYSTSLISLSVHDCGIKEISDNAFNTLSHLRKLSLAYNNITSVRDRWFAKLLSLQQLDLSHNLIASIEPAVFEKLRDLKRLDVRGNRLICLEPAQLLPMAGLEKLLFSGNPLSFRCRGTLTLWLHDMGINYKTEQRGEQDWLDSILWLCAADDGKVADSEVLMKECVILNLFNQLRTGLTTAESFPLKVPQDCVRARNELTICVVTNRRHSREVVTNGHVMRKLLRLLRESKSSL